MLAVGRGRAPQRVICWNMGNGGLLGLQGHYIRDPEYEAGVRSSSTDDLMTRESDTRQKMFRKIKRTQEVPEVGQVRVICIEGAVGKFSRHINTSFVETAQMYNNHTLYRNFPPSSEHWLRYATNGQWMVSNTQDKDENLCGGVCLCETVGLSDPTCAKDWYVLDKQGEFRAQVLVKATELMYDEVELQNVVEKIQSVENGVLAVTRSNSNQVEQKSIEERRTAEQISLQMMFRHRHRRRRAPIGRVINTPAPAKVGRRRKYYFGNSKQTRGSCAPAAPRFEPGSKTVVLASFDSTRKMKTKASPYMEALSRRQQSVRAL